MLREHHSFVRQRIKLWCGMPRLGAIVFLFAQVLKEYTDIALAQFVGKYKIDIGFFLRGFRPQCRNGED
jgi:hypothetical protein